jgi:hypothetical protein
MEAQPVRGLTAEERRHPSALTPRSLLYEM